MLRTTWVRRNAFTDMANSAKQSVVTAAASAVPKPEQMQALDLQSPYQMLRMLLKSIDTKVKSRHGRKYLKQRLLSQWRLFRTVDDPFQQRFVLERGASVLTALHMTEENKQKGTPPTFDWTRASGKGKASPTERRREAFDKEFK
jgi:hypothetical protein